MPKLKPIIEAINSHFKSVAFNTAEFGGAQFKGVAESYYKLDGDNKFLVPQIVDDYGNAEPIYPDDSFPLLIFHKINGIKTISAPAVKQYGRGENTIERKADCSVFAIATRNKIKLSKDDLELIISTSMPSILSPASLSALHLKSCSINVVGSEINSQTIYAREYPEATNPLSPSQILIEVKYTIGCVFDKSCVNLVCC